MKTSRSTNWIQLILLCLALTLLVILLTIPLLAKGISQIAGHPTEPEKLDIRSIPVPVPPPVAINESQALATPSPKLSAVAIVPVAVAVPAPSDLVQMQAARAEPSRVDVPSTSTIQLLNLNGVFVNASALLVLLISLWSYRAPKVHSLREECA